MMASDLVRNRSRLPFFFAPIIRDSKANSEVFHMEKLTDSLGLLMRRRPSVENIHLAYGAGKHRLVASALRWRL